MLRFGLFRLILLVLGRGRLLLGLRLILWFGLRLVLRLRLRLLLLFLLGEQFTDAQEVLQCLSGLSGLGLLLQGKGLVRQALDLRTILGF